MMPIRAITNRCDPWIWPLVVLFWGLVSTGAWAFGASLVSGLSEHTCRVATYPFTMGGQGIGSIVCCFGKDGQAAEGDAPYVVSSELRLDFNKINIPKTISADGKATFDEKGQLRAYHLDMAVNHQKVTIRCTTDGRLIEETLKVGENTYRKKLVADRLPFYIVDNNMIGLWSLMASQLDTNSKPDLSVNGFFPQSLKFVMMKLQFIRKEDITIGNTTYPASVFMVEPINEMMWITDSGILAKIEAPYQKLRIGPVMIETTTQSQ